MDWRLITSLASAGGAFGLAALVAYTAMATGPVEAKKFAPAPTLLSERTVTSGSVTSNSALAPRPSFALSNIGTSAVVVAADLPQITESTETRREVHSLPADVVSGPVTKSVTRPVGLAPAGRVMHSQPPVRMALMLGVAY